MKKLGILLGTAVIGVIASAKEVKQAPAEIGSLSNGVGKKQINFYMAPVGFPLELFCYQ